MIKQRVLAIFILFKILYLDKLFSFSTKLFFKQKAGENILIVCGGGIGDIITDTAVLKHYRNYFRNKKIYLLTNLQNNAKAILKNYFSDEIIEVDFYKFKRSYIYALKVYKKLKDIGFETIIYNITINIINLSPLYYLLDAREKIAYEGELWYRNIKKDEDYIIWFSNKYIFPKIKKEFTKIIESYSQEKENGVLVNVIKHKVKIFEDFTGQKIYDYSTFVPKSDLNYVSKDILKISRNKYFIIVPGAGAYYRRWPFERFIKVTKEILKIDKNLLPIFIGSPAEKNIIKDLDKTLPQALNLVGKLNFEELKFLIENCQFLIGNEQGLIHLAIALKKPTICIIGGGHLGRYSHYGDSNINKWVYDENAKCKFDNWRCALKENTICAPCIFSITEEMVMREVNNLLKFINEGL